MSSAPTPSVHYTEYGIPIRNLWHMLLYAWNEVPIKSHWSLQDVESAPTLDALLAAVLAGLIQQRMRIGLGRSYVDQHRSVQGIRGRINFPQSLSQRSFEREEAVCEFQEYGVNTPKNQIVRSTLARLVQLGNFGPDHSKAERLRHVLRQLTRALDGIDIIELKLDFLRRQQFDHSDRDYRLMLAICELSLKRQMPAEVSGRRALPQVEHEALLLYDIYERFVASFYRIHLKDFTVKVQSRLSWHAKIDNPYLPSMQPDLVIQDNHSHDITVLDTKFTAKSLVANEWGKEIFDSSHIYQLYAYLSSQKHLSDKRQKVSGILLYPAVNRKLSERIELQDHVIRIECIDLAAPWQEVEKNLLQFVTPQGSVQ
jgi:5-methylcytosine-specific restriction enzyme subunit McrC